MAATFRTPGRRQGGEAINIGSPSLIPTRATQHHHSTPGTPTTPHGTSSSEVGTNVSSDSRKRQSKKDEVFPLPNLLCKHRLKR